MSKVSLTLYMTSMSIYNKAKRSKASLKENRDKDKDKGENKNKNKDKDKRWENLKVKYSLTRQVSYHVKGVVLVINTLNK